MKWDLKFLSNFFIAGDFDSLHPDATLHNAVVRRRDETWPFEIGDVTPRASSS